MQFNLYLDDKTAQRLKEATNNSKDTRNAIIRNAITQWLDKTQQNTWPEELLSFSGIPDTAPFESSRNELKDPIEDPFA